MCMDSLMGGKSKSQRNMQIWQAQQDERIRQEQKAEQERQYAENERQRIEAQAQMEARYQAQIEREKALVDRQINAQDGIAVRAIEAAKAAEASRQSQITQGRSAIDTAFAGFNDGYYDQARQKYTDAYLPQLEQDRLKSADKLKAALAGRGTLESTVGINAFSDLEQRAATERATIAARGSDFAESLRARVNQSKGSLYETAASGGDPSGWASRAIGEATSLLNFGDVVPAGPANAFGASYYSPQGGTTTVPGAQNSSVFGAVLAPLVSAATSAINAPKSVKTLANTAPTTGAGTAKVVS